MENDSTQINNYSFLSDEFVEKHFADLNILLLSGKHIDQSEYNLFTLLEDYFEPHLKGYYENLYKLNLSFEGTSSERYYYLDFFDTGKGKIVDTKRRKELTELQTIIGLMLLDMYYQKYFELQKIITWKDIETIVLESELQKQYQKILFNTVRDSNSYDDTEWSRAKSNIKRAIENFNKLGWINLIDEIELIFEIKPSINRLAKLYEQELTDFDSFVKSIKPDIEDELS